MKVEPASIADWRAAIEAVETAVPYFAMLQDASLRFLDSEHVLAAVECEWDAVELFGVHKGVAPNLRPDTWGLLPFIGWSLFGHTIQSIDREFCALLT